MGIIKLFSQGFLSLRVLYCLLVEHLSEVRTYKSQRKSIRIKFGTKLDERNKKLESQWDCEN